MRDFNNLNADELMAICSAISIYLSEGRTSDELNVLSNMALAVGSLLSVAANQKKILEDLIDDIEA